MRDREIERLEVELAAAMSCAEGWKKFAEDIQVASAERKRMLQAQRERISALEQVLAAHKIGTHI